MISTIIAIIIALALLSTLFKALVDAIKEHWYFVISAIAVIISLVYFDDTLISLGVAAGFVVVWMIWKWAMNIRYRIQMNHEAQLWGWLNINCRTLGKVSAVGISEVQRKIMIPVRFQRYTYPRKSTCKDILSSFLRECQSQLESNVKTSIYDTMQYAGMLSDADIQNRIAPQFERVTRTRELSVVCAEAINCLLQEGKLDRPIQGEKVLHCVGITVGTNFESEELSI